jgi:predicted PurR-regulated permease PerM
MTVVSTKSGESRASAFVAMRASAAPHAEPPPRAAAIEARRSWTRPLWIIAICCLLVVLRLGRAAFIPLGLAVLVAFVLSSVVDRLRRWHIPRAVSAGVLLLLLAAAAGGIVEAIATPAQTWMQSAPRVLRVIEHRLRPAQSLVHRLDDIAQRAEALAMSGSSSTAGANTNAPAAAPTSVTALELFAVTGWAAFLTVTVLAFAFLLLAASPNTLARITGFLVGVAQTHQALRLLDGIRSEVGRYYGTLLLINCGFGIVMGTTLWLLGMPNAALWAVMASVLNFVPYVGPAITFAVVSVVALVTFDSTAHVLLVSACYLGLATIEGHIVEPVFLGRRLDLSPILVLFALWIGGWLWGVAGMILALPVLLATRVAARLGTTPPP